MRPMHPRPATAPRPGQRAVAAAALAALVFAAGLPAPGRGAVTAPYASAGRAPLAPGVTHDWGTLTTTPGGTEAVHIVEVATTTPEIGVEVMLGGDRITALTRTTTQALATSRDGHRAVAAINGDTWGGFDSATKYAPTGIDIHAGELVTAAPTVRPTLGIGPGGLALMGNVRVTMSVTMPDGTTRTIDRVNQLRNGSQLALYTPRFGTTTAQESVGTDVVLGGLALPLAPTGVQQAVVLEVRPALGGLPIPPDAVVLNGPAGSALDALLPGTILSLSFALPPGWENVREAIGGRETLVQDGLPFVSPRSTVSAQLHPRTAVALTAGGTLLMVTVDGRRSDSAGVDLDELAELLVSRGAAQAIALDGGGSTTLALRQPGDVEVTLANRPSDGVERGVANSLVVFSYVPTGPLASLVVAPGTATLKQGATATFAARGQDGAWNGVSLAPGEVAWSVVGPGTIGAGGAYTASAAGAATVVATARGVSGSAAVTVEGAAPPPAPLPPLAISSSSALGFAPRSGYTAKTPKVQRLRGYVTWTFDGGPALAGQRVNVLLARKGAAAWGAPTYLKSAWADAAGVVTFSMRSLTAAAVNLRVQWPGGAAYGVSTSPALGAYWR